MARILLAEDEADLRSALADYLRDSGHDVLEAADGEEAIRRLQQDRNLDLVLTDIFMPRYTGYEVAEHARWAKPDLPIVFISGRPEALRLDEYAQPASCLAKPISGSNLLGTVKEMLGSRH
jgi:CheY-like chemotaxis protein